MKDIAEKPGISIKTGFLIINDKNMKKIKASLKV